MSEENNNKIITKNEIVYGLTTGYGACMFWCTLVTFIVYIVGFSTTSWFITSSLFSNFQHGLWEKCICTGPIISGYETDHRAAQAIAILSFIFSVASIVLCCLYNFVDRFDKIKLINGFTVCLTVTLILNIISVSVYGSIVNKMQKDGVHGRYGYSFVLVIISIFGNAGSIMLAVMQYTRGSTMPFNS